MIVYKVFSKNYDLRTDELVGVLTERRSNLRGRTRLESASRWARLMFGHMVRDKHSIFVVPDEFNYVSDAKMFAEETPIRKEELCRIIEARPNGKMERQRSSDAGFRGR